MKASDSYCKKTRKSESQNVLKMYLFFYHFLVKMYLRL